MKDYGQVLWRWVHKDYQVINTTWQLCLAYETDAQFPSPALPAQERKDTLDKEIQL